MLEKYSQKISKILIMICVLCSMLSHFDMSAQAATVSRVKTPQMLEMTCDILLEGIIQEGDAAAVKIELLKLIEQNSGLSRVCLNSPGGSLGEALKFADIGMPGFTTALPAGANCESACSIIFFMGRKDILSDREVTDRLMHPTARLGVHAPSLVLPDREFNRREVEAAYEVALETLQRLMGMQKFDNSLQSGSRNIDIPRSLFLEILSTPPSKLSYIETVGDAARWGVSLYPVKLPKISKKTWGNFCVNAHRLIFDNDSKVQFNEKGIVTTKSKVNNFEFSDRYEVSITSGESGYPGCSISVNTSYVPIYSNAATWENLSDIEKTWYKNGVAGTRANVTSQRSFFSSDWSEKTIFFPQYLFYPPGTKIENVEIAYSLKMTAISKVLGLEARTDTKTTNLSCGIFSEIAIITNVQKFTNLRQKAGLNQPVMGQVPLGAEVSIVSPGQFLRYDRCAAACSGNGRNAINQCIDNNDVWIEVEYNGRRGFLSRKFLEWRVRVKKRRK